MSDHDDFKKECAAEVAAQGKDRELRDLTLEWVLKAAEYKYSYHFEWLGLPIIQHPQDMVGVQQLLWKVQPDLIIETGVARGGSMIFYASILELIALCGGPQNGKVIGVDIDIRKHNRDAIEAHPMARRIELVQGSSIAPETFAEVRRLAKGHGKILVCLDSNHTHEHVLDELRLYAPLVSRGSYCIVFDTIIADMPEDAFPDRPWSKARNPKSAVAEYLEGLRTNPAAGLDGAPLQLTIDREIENLMLITVAPDGFLLRT